MINIPLAIISWIYGYLLCKRWNSQTNNDTFALAKTCVAMSVPFVLTYHSLYYTDTGGMAFVLATLYHIRSRRYLSLCFAILAVLFRQNNIIWVAFAVLLDTAPIILSSFPRHVLFSWNVAPPRIMRLFREYFGFAALGIAFGLFVFYNRGIVVGAKTEHQPVFHVAQLAYLILFCGAYCLLDILIAVASPSFNNIEKTRNLTHQYWMPFYSLSFLTSAPSSRQRANAGGDGDSTTSYASSLSLMKIGGNLLFLTLTFFWLYYFSYSHPYLISDNRHISFYLWQRFLGKSPLLRAALAPVYIALGCLIYSRLVYPNVKPVVIRDDGTFTLELASANEENSAKFVRRNSYWFWCWLFCSALVLIPAQLLEFRYFAIPLALFLLRFPVSSTQGVFFMLLINLLLYGALSYLFLFKPFTAPDGSLGRFIW